MSTTTAPRREYQPIPPPPKGPRTPSVGDVLERAADRIERKGLWQAGVKGTSDGDCIVTAITAGLRLGQDVTDADADAYCVALGFDDAKTAARWNDAPGRTITQVLARLRGAAAAARGETA